MNLRADTARWDAERKQVIGLDVAGKLTQHYLSITTRKGALSLCKAIQKKMLSVESVPDGDFDVFKSVQPGLGIFARSIEPARGYPEWAEVELSVWVGENHIAGFQAFFDSRTKRLSQSYMGVRNSHAVSAGVRKANQEIRLMLVHGELAIHEYLLAVHGQEVPPMERAQTIPGPARKPRVHQRRG